MIIKTGIYSNEICNFFLYISMSLISARSHNIFSEKKLISKDSIISRSADGELQIETNNSNWINYKNFKNLLSKIIHNLNISNNTEYVFSDAFNTSYSIKKISLQILKELCDRYNNFSKENLENMFSKKDIDDFFGKPYNDNEISNKIEYQKKLNEIKKNFFIEYEKLKKDERIFEFEAKKDFDNDLKNLEIEKESFIDEIEKET